ALLLSGLALLCALIGLSRRDRRQGPALMYFVMLLAAWILGFFNALIHARDAWAIMPGALVLSVLVTILALAVVWLVVFSLRDGGLRWESPMPAGLWRWGPRSPSGVATANRRETTVPIRICRTSSAACCQA